MKCYAVAYTPRAGGGVLERTRTLDEAIAAVREYATERRPDTWEWLLFQITHDDGRRWYWEMAGPNVTLKVDTP